MNSKHNDIVYKHTPIYLYTFIYASNMSIFMSSITSMTYETSTGLTPPEKHDFPASVAAWDGQGLR